VLELPLLEQPQEAQMGQDSHKPLEQEHQLFCIYWQLHFVTYKVGMPQLYHRELF
jgi:hypothetical protein